MARAFWTTLTVALGLQFAALAVYVAVTIHGQANAVSATLHQTAQLSQLAAIKVR